MKRKFQATIATLYSINCLFGMAEEINASRNASTNEIQELFDLSISRPARSKFTADIELKEPASSKEQIIAELKTENEIMKDRDRRLSQEQIQNLTLTRSNALVYGMSGTRVQHVKEWYSGHYYRLDQTDEALFVLTNEAKIWKANSNFYHDTFVNIHDTNFSPYTSFNVNHELRDATLTRNSDTYYRSPNDLWRSGSMDQQVAIPIMFALLDIHSLNTNAAQSLNKLDMDVLLSSAKSDSRKVQQLHDGTSRNWHLETYNETFDGVPVIRYKLKGNYPDPNTPRPLSSICVEYWINHIAGKAVCLQAMLTNFTLKSSFFSKREQFDSNGLPHIWETHTIKDGVVKEFNVKFKEINLNPSFADTDIFAPKFSTNYTVWDLTAGTARILQNAHPEAKIVQHSSFSIFQVHMILVRTIIFTAFFIPPLIMLYMAIKKRLSK